MTTKDQTSLSGWWLADDGSNLSAGEALGLLGVAIWGGALACMVISDIIKDRVESDRGHASDWQRWEREIDSDR